MMNDIINNPSHYVYLKPQPIELIGSLPFIQGNIIKYIVRYNHSRNIIDLKKARKYAEFAMAYNLQSFVSNAKFFEWLPSLGIELFEIIERTLISDWEKVLDKIDNLLK